MIPHVNLLYFFNFFWCFSKKKKKKKSLLLPLLTIHSGHCPLYVEEWKSRGLKIGNLSANFPDWCRKRKKKNVLMGALWVGDLVVSYLNYNHGWLCVYEVISGSAHVLVILNLFFFKKKTYQSNLLFWPVCCVVQPLFRKANDSEQAIRFDLRSIALGCPTLPTLLNLVFLLYSSS